MFIDNKSKKKNYPKLKLCIWILFSIQYQGLLALRERHTEQDIQFIAATQNMMIRVHEIIEFTAMTLLLEFERLPRHTKKLKRTQRIFQNF